MTGVTGRCSICDNDEDNVSYTAREMMYGSREEFPYFQCSRCSCLQIAKVPDDLARFYPPQYHDLPAADRRLSGVSGRLRGLRYRAALSPNGPWKRILGSKRFREHFELAGDSLKRPPRGYDPEHPLVEDLKRKDYITVASFTEREACRPEFFGECAARGRIAAPFVRFLTNALELEW